MPKYFISHATEDRDFVESQILDLLNALDIKYWYSKDDIITSALWERSIKKALESCDGFLLIMSPNSAVSEWVKDELNWAIENKPGRVIPILYKKSRLEDFHIRLPRIQYADFSENSNSGPNKLIRLLNNIEFEANSRVNAIEGTWKGKFTQPQFGLDKLTEFPITIVIQISHKREFTGTIAVIAPDGQDVEFTLTGGFLYDRFCQFSYFAIDPGRVQFGTIIMELDEIGSLMSGNWIGYGAYSKKIVNGALTVHKIKP